MGLIVAIFLAWPTFGISLVVYAVVKFALHANRKQKIIQEAIKHLARENDAMGTSYREISFNQANSYAGSDYCQIIKIENGITYFTTRIDNNNYIVELKKTPDGFGSILNAKIDKIANLHEAAKDLPREFSKELRDIFGN